MLDPLATALAFQVEFFTSTQRELERTTPYRILVNTYQDAQEIARVLNGTICLRDSKGNYAPMTTAMQAVMEQNTASLLELQDVDALKRCQHGFDAILVDMCEGVL